MEIKITCKNTHKKKKNQKSVYFHACCGAFPLPQCLHYGERLFCLCLSHGDTYGNVLPLYLAFWKKNYLISYKTYNIDMDLVINFWILLI